MIRFLANITPYRAGDIAGFNPDIEALLVRKGQAELIDNTVGRVEKPFSPVTSGIPIVRKCNGPDCGKSSVKSSARKPRKG